MKNNYFKKQLFALIIFILTTFNIRAQTIIPVNQSFSNDTLLLSNYITPIYGLSVDADIILYNDTSNIRIILIDIYKNEYLVCDINVLNADSNKTMELNNYCYESCYLPFTEIKNIKLKITDGLINILNFTIKTSFDSSLAKKQSDMFRQRNIENVIKINEYIKRNKYSWIADTTNFSKLTYIEKKKYFGKEELPNLYGFDYYAGGYFSFPQAYNSNEINKSDNIISDFDWRNRHGANNPSSLYYDGDNIDFSGWNTTRAEYQIAPNCWAFAPVYSMEALINLYYNQHLNINLSEQDVISCSNGQVNDTCYGGFPYMAVKYIVDTGVTNESCFPYSGLCWPYMPDCSNKCTNPEYLFKASGYFSSYPATEDEIKEKIITNGPIVGSVSKWGHAMSLVGYGKVREDDIIMSGNVPFSDVQEVLVVPGSPDIGKTYWIFKNSWGSWGSDHTPYMKLIMNLSNLKLYWNTVPLICNGSHALTEEDRKCLDLDGDGYYWWGIGDKPNTCPIYSPNERDCDDSNPFLGPYDPVTFECQILCNNFTYNPNPIIISNSETWNDKIINQSINITYGATLTIRGKVIMQENCKLIIEPGATLIIDGGTLTNACGDMWQGIEVWGNKDLSQYPQSNQGVVELKNGATIENARCAITTCQKDAEGNILWAYTGGIIHAKDANFINNRKAIEFLSYHNILPNGREIANSSYFYNCTFETNAQLSDPGTLPETFVSLYDVKGVKFLGCTFQNIAPTGVYSTIYRGNGITSIDANYEVKPLCLSPYIYPCTEYQPNTFKNLYYGIYASNTNPAITLTINGNNFDNNHRSIFLKGINNATITKNNFDIGATIGNINDQTNEREACDVFNRSYSYGVYLKECSGYKVEENNFSTTHDGHAGIIVDNSGTKANEIYNNTFDKLAIGTQAQGINAAGGVIISKSSNPEHIEINVGQGLQFLCNQYFNISTADIAVTSGRIAQNQGYCRDNNPALPAGNKFSHTCNISTSDIHVNSDASKFNYSHHSELDYIPLCYSSDKVTLHDCHIKYDPRTSCPSHLNSGLTPVVLKQIINTNKLEIEELISLIDNGETETLLAQIHQNEEPERIKNALESASPYLSDRVLLAAIKEKPKPLPLDILKEIIISNSPVTDTVMSALNTLKLPDDIQQQIQEVQKGTSARAELEQQISYMETQKGIAENELMRQYLNDTTINGTDSIIAYLEMQTDLINKKQLVQAYLVANLCEKAKILLGQLPQENDEDKNFYNFYNLLSDLCVSEKSYFELTSAQEQTVREIAKSETSVSVNA